MARDLTNNALPSECVSFVLLALKKVRRTNDEIVEKLSHSSRL